MNLLVFLIPVALALGALGLAGFLWSLNNGQYDDLDGAAERILEDEDDNHEFTRQPASGAADPSRGGR